MRVIKPGTVHEWMKKHPPAKAGLEWWLVTVKAARWSNLAEMRRTMPGADQVMTESKRHVVVFNIAGNKFRLIAAVHFNRGLVYALAFMTHAEYSKNRWRDKL
jgi:mRNA interferase HigB